MNQDYQRIARNALFSNLGSVRLTTRCLKPFIMGDFDIVFQISPSWITDSRYPQQALLRRCRPQYRVTRQISTCGRRWELIGLQGK